MARRGPGNLPSWPPDEQDGAQPPLATTSSSGSDDTARGVGNAGQHAQGAARSAQGLPSVPQPGELDALDFGAWPFAHQPHSNSTATSSPYPAAQRPASPFSQQTGQGSHQPDYQHYVFPRDPPSQPFPPTDFIHPSFWNSAGASPGFSQQQPYGGQNQPGNGVSLSMLEMATSDPSRFPPSQPHSTLPPASTSAPSSLMALDEPAWRPTTNASPPLSADSTRASKRSRPDSSHSSTSWPGLDQSFAPDQPRYQAAAGVAAGGGTSFSTHPALQQLSQPPLEVRQGGAQGAYAAAGAGLGVGGSSGTVQSPMWGNAHAGAVPPSSGSGGPGSGSGSGSNGSQRGSTSTTAGGTGTGGSRKDSGFSPGMSIDQAIGAASSALGESWRKAAADEIDEEALPAESGATSANVGPNTKLVQRADKSCKKCRDEVEEGGDAERIARLQAKVAQLERQLKSASLTGKPASHSPAESQRSGEGAMPNNVFSVNSYPMDNAAASVSAAVQDIWAHKLRLGSEEADVLAAFLQQRSVSHMDVGRGSLAWRLGEPNMAKFLTFHLLDAALYACCSKLPGVKPLADCIDEYKTNIDVLNPQQQCAVAVLCALGARATPRHLVHSPARWLALPPAYLHAGERRELACRQLEARARELCWSHGFFDRTDLSILHSMVGLVQVLIYEEVLPKQSRFFCRSAIGMYLDLRHEALERNERTSLDPRSGPGTALFLADAVISSSCSRPSFITTGELDQYIVTDGVNIPDFPGSDLGDELKEITQRPLTREKLASALTTACLWLSTGRRPGAPSTLPLLKSLWKLIDKVHNAIQQLQQLLVSLSVNQVAGCEDEPYGLEHFVLLGVRYDAILVDLINLQHVYLIRNRNGPGVWAESEDDELLAAMRQESELRVRKCLKLSSFYAQLYLQSQDKHLVHHMLMELEMLPDWTVWAAQRIGTPGGPLSEEYELTENELDWYDSPFQQALELSSYYTPKATHRLQALAQARKRFQGREVKSVDEQLKTAPNPLPHSALPAVDSLNAQQAAISSHKPSNPRYHYDFPPHNKASISPLAPREDPESLFDVTSVMDDDAMPLPRQLYVFDSYGIAAAHGFPLSSQPPVPSADFVQANFRGQNWMEQQVPMPQHNETQAHFAHAGDALGGDTPEWMRSAGRGQDAPEPAPARSSQSGGRGAS
ncbi:hypothetical protein Rhopal_006231-T1 [Rhodotorula paludigena]|uniref:Transcription factor domain-containing protein n=1 Tax=Rhodotorula paludigena TaxID=86838 RepID=A0AAV5GVE4_9BASI|nr:hypothetical protein Rhopal_006231-T1 [Rhodotorula paludigena]